MKKKASKTPSQDQPVSPLCDDELAYTVPQLLAMLRRKKDRHKLLWIVARVCGWRYNHKDISQPYWRWDRDNLRCKITAHNHPEYLEDLNELAIVESRILKSRPLAFRYSVQLRTVLHYALKHTVADVDGICASAAHRAVALVALHIEEYKLNLPATPKVKSVFDDLRVGTHPAYDYLYPGSV